MYYKMMILSRYATRKQCKVILLLQKRLLVTIPQTPEILNFVEGCAFKER